jgi:hypothetical protein
MRGFHAKFTELSSLFVLSGWSLIPIASRKLQSILVVGVITSALKLYKAHFSETSASTNQFTWSLKPEHHHHGRRKNLRFYFVTCWLYFSYFFLEIGSIRLKPPD